jgi:hypothetical protein
MAIHLNQIQMNSDEIRNSVSQLLDQSQIQKLSSLIQFGNGSSIKYDASLDSSEGIYAFWLDNPQGIVKNLNRKVCISGPNKKMEKMEWDWNLDEKNILLYVGKSTNIKKRISLHLKLGTIKWETESKDNTLAKQTTSCQLRAGIEHLILNNPEFESFEFLNKYIGVTLVRISDFKNRFYAEDLAVGEGIPWFNVDSER